MAWDPGRIGPYRIVQRISAGGAGVTYLALSEAVAESALLVCVKTPHPMWAHDSRYLRVFENEARFAGLLDHPHIVPLRDVGTGAGERLYLAYRFIEGLDLGELIAGVRDGRQQLAWPLLVVIAAQVARALEYAHQDQRDSGRIRRRPAVIHRDLCPANILIGLSGASYLTDFGIARALEESSLLPSLRGAGRIAYCAPERLRKGREYDARADLFSLGAVLFEALTGQKPYSSDSIMAHLHQVFRDHRPRVEPLRAEFHESSPGPPPEGLVQLVAIVHRLLEPDPDRRYPSAAAVVDDLGRIAVPASTHRELTMAVEDHMPAWRREIRLRTGEIPAFRPKGGGLWSSTDPERLAHLERDAFRVSPSGAQRLLEGGPDPGDGDLGDSGADLVPAIDTTALDRPRFAPAFDTTDPDRPSFAPAHDATPGDPTASTLGTTAPDRPVFEGPGAPVALAPVALDTTVPDRPTFDPEADSPH